MEIKSFFEYKWKYLFANIFKRFAPEKAQIDEYLYVTHEGTKGWILDAKAQRLAANSGLNAKVCYSDSFRNLPDAKGYFFLHQKYFARSIRYNPFLLKRKLIVMFTHPEWNSWYSAKHMAYVLGFADHIVCLNSSVKNELISLGIPESKISMFHMASNPEFFTPKTRTGNGAVGFSMAYGPRKNPQIVIELIKKMNYRNFILIGPRWRDCKGFTDIENLERFKYYENIDYSEYPNLYHQMEVLVSPSVLEGGPVPILEAMLSNVVPVASKTGFCPDIIKHGENGYLFEIDASADEIVNLIDQAYNLKTNVREGIDQHSWKVYGKKIKELFDNITG